MKTLTLFPFYELRLAVTQNPIIEVKTITQALEVLNDGDKLLIMQEDENIYFSTGHFCNYVYMRVSAELSPAFKQ
jgi:hypothetical protein